MHPKRPARFAGGASISSRRGGSGPNHQDDQQIIRIKDVLWQRHGARRAEWRSATVQWLVVKSHVVVTATPDIPDETLIFDFYGRDNAFDVLIERHSRLLADFFAERSKGKNIAEMISATWRSVEDSKKVGRRRFTISPERTFKEWLSSLATAVPLEHPDEESRREPSNKEFAIGNQAIDSEKTDEILIADFYGDDSALHTLSQRHSPRLNEYFKNKLGTERPDLIDLLWRRVGRTKNYKRTRYERSAGPLADWLDRLAEDIWLGDCLYAYYNCYHDPNKMHPVCGACEGAFQPIERCFTPELLKLLQSLRLSEEACWDLLQGIYLEVTRSKRFLVQRYNPEDGDFGGWLRQKAVWRRLEQLRRIKGKNVIVSLLQPDENGRSLIDVLEDAGESPEAQVCGRACIGTLEQAAKEECINTLPDKERKIILARRAGRKLESIAADENCAIGAIFNRERAAWRKVHDCMRQKNYHYPYLYPHKLNFLSLDGVVRGNGKTLMVDAGPLGWEHETGCLGSDFQPGTWLLLTRDNPGKATMHVRPNGLPPGEYVGGVLVSFPENSRRSLEFIVKVVFTVIERQADVKEKEGANE